MFACQFYRDIDLGSESTSVITKAYTAMRLLLSIHIDSSRDLELRLQSTIVMSSVWKKCDASDAGCFKWVREPCHVCLAALRKHGGILSAPQHTKARKVACDEEFRMACHE